jgi:chaperonin GroES
LGLVGGVRPCSVTIPIVTFREKGDDPMNFRPIHDHVLVKRVEELETKVRGIIVPDMAKEKPQQGEVIAAGDGTILATGERVPLEVKAGERILFGKYSGSEIKIEGQEYLVFREDDILAVLE